MAPCEVVASWVVVEDVVEAVGEVEVVVLYVLEKSPEQVGVTRASGLIDI
jgi:hypothetical protein